MMDCDKHELTNRIWEGQLSELSDFSSCVHTSVREQLIKSHSGMEHSYQFGVFKALVGRWHRTDAASIDSNSSRSHSSNQPPHCSFCTGNPVFLRSVGVHSCHSLTPGSSTAPLAPPLAAQQQTEGSQPRNPSALPTEQQQQPCMCVCVCVWEGHFLNCSRLEHRLCDLCETFCLHAVSFSALVALRCSSCTAPTHVFDKLAMLNQMLLRLVLMSHLASRWFLA